MYEYINMMTGFIFCLSKKIYSDSLFFVLAPSRDTISSLNVTQQGCEAFKLPFSPLFE